MHPIGHSTAEAGSLVGTVPSLCREVYRLGDELQVGHS